MNVKITSNVNFKYVDKPMADDGKCMYFIQILSMSGIYSTDTVYQSQLMEIDIPKEPISFTFDIEESKELAMIAQLVWYNDTYSVVESEIAIDKPGKYTLQTSDSIKCEKLTDDEIQHIDDLTTTRPKYLRLSKETFNTLQRLYNCIENGFRISEELQEDYKKLFLESKFDLI